MAEVTEAEKFLEDPTKHVAAPQPINFRTIYRRRGSDLVFEATLDGRVQVSRFSHRAKVSKYYIHDVEAFEAKRIEIQQMFEPAGYKLVSREAVT